MKILRIWVFVLASFALSASVSFAQDERKRYDLNLPENDSVKSMFFNGRQAFFEERLHQPFPSLGFRKTIDGIAYDFDQAGRCRIILFGFSDCAPCRVQLPYFLALSNNKHFADIDFLYISYDDSATIMKEITRLYNGPHHRVSMFSFSREFLTFSDNPRLTYGYPAMYFIDSSRLVKAIIIGGRPAAQKTQSRN